MAKHQIIYTSCIRGIDGVNDGQQIYSYDATFKDSKMDEVRRLFTYQIPSLQPGVVMNEEIALTMPSAFSFRLLDSGKCSITMNTYLGRDYMGSAGRFGNHLSHAIICDRNDFTLYPCELYGSSVLRKSMEYDKVNNPQAPDYLPEPSLEKGYIVDIDSVTEFLGIGENLENYKKMFCALLRFNKDRKRIVICDNPENIIMWIAALEYTLPLEIVKNINFTTYEFDPELSSSQICGVISEGTRYNCSVYVASGRHYVFDFINSIVPDMDITEDFFEFIDTAMSFAYDSLIDFQKFVLEKTTYRSADEDYYAAHALYELLTDDLEQLNQDKFILAVSFSEKFASAELIGNLTTKLLLDTNTINKLDNEFALNIIRFVLKFMENFPVDNKEALKQMIVKRLLLSFSDKLVDETKFNELYISIDSIAKGVNLSIPAELMNRSNQAELLNVMSQGVAKWKIYFIVKIICDYVKDQRLPAEELFPDRPIGKLYFGIIKAVYSTGRQNGYEIIEKVLDNFKTDSLYLVNMALNIEGFLDDIGLEGIDKKHLWDYFMSLSIQQTTGDITVINTAFDEWDRYDEMFALYCCRVNAEKDMKKIKEIFRDTFEIWFNKSSKYAAVFSLRVMQVYADAYQNKLSSLMETEQYEYAKELLHISMEMQVEDEYVDVLIAAVSEYMPLEKPSRENEKLINEIFEYQFNFRHKRIEGKLLLLRIGMSFDRIRGHKDISEIVKKINSFASEKGGNLRNIEEKITYSYFEWMLPGILQYRITANEFELIFQLFDMSKKSERDFMEYCCKEYFKSSKESKDYEAFSEFLKFMFENGNDDDIENAGKILCKLSKQKLEDLDEEMMNYYKRDRKATHRWEEVREVAQSTNPLLNNISGLFKRRKD